MPRKQYSPEESDTILKRVETLVSDGVTVNNACKRSGISLNTYYRWRQTHNAQPSDPIKRVYDLERENLRLKRAVADLTVEMLILKESVELSEHPAHRSGCRSRPH